VHLIFVVADVAAADDDDATHKNVLKVLDS
jgi:hypothetical protein